MRYETRLTTDLFRRKKVLVDSNLLLLLVIGSWNPAAIAGFKRLSGLNFQDFDLLRIFLSGFTQIVTTAHILTEVSNLVGALSGEFRKKVFLHFSGIIQTLDERFIASSSLTLRPEFQPFGLTDAALSALCPEMVVVTQDGRLAGYLQNMGLQALSLANIRSLRSQAKYAK